MYRLDMCRLAEASDLPRNHGRQLGAVDAGALAHGLADVSAHSAEAEAEDAGDIAVGAAAGNQRRDLVFPRRQPFGLALPKEGAAHMRLQGINQSDLARAEIGPAARPPDAQVAEVAL